jgi:hypothetical protein
MGVQGLYVFQFVVDMTAMSWQRNLFSMSGIAAARLVMHFAVEIVQELVCESLWEGLMKQRSYVSSPPCEPVRADGGSGPKKYSLTCDPCRGQESHLHIQESCPHLRQLENLRISRSTLSQYVKSNCLGRSEGVSYRGEARESHLVHGVWRTDIRKDLIASSLHILRQLIRRCATAN